MKTTSSPFLLMASLLTMCFWLTAGCEGTASDFDGSADPDDAAFVTLLGDDTLAVERFSRTDSGMEADVVLRTPRTTIRHYELELDEDGGLSRYEAEIRIPGASGDTAVSRREIFTPEGDSLRAQITDEGETQEQMIEGGPDALPFIDMVHWPFELMLTRARESAEARVDQPLFTGRGAMNFVVEDFGEDSMTVTHPFRGTMEVEVDPEGRLIRLDAGATTRKLVVQRTSDVDVDAAGRRFAERDAAGSTFGPLSGRGEATAEIDGAQITVDYGRPSKRGREIFGHLVPWGELWRTGANRATHIETDRALDLDGLDVPAGSYTLYTIPEPDGGTLIVNRQTGQGGTTYDEDQDLGRVDMQMSELTDEVEDFTIVVDDTESGGALRLQWDRTEFAVPFTVEE